MKTKLKLPTGMITLLLISMCLMIVTDADAANLSDCETKARTVEVIKMSYDKGIAKEKILIIYQGSDEWSRAVRAMIHHIWRGTSDHLTSDDMYRITYDLCDGQEASN